ncbi:SMC-Scp complex subunit ScpB [Candidatus Pacearchaeota archaeon]|nr:SMC-Scp complex subunit ScpB [Candidatus Pacearchaeota archaeon]
MDDSFTGNVNELDEAREVDNIRKVEAALFVSGKFMSLKELVALTDVNPLLLRDILRTLEERYKGKGVEVVRREDLWKMDVHPDFVYMVNRLATGNSEFTKAEQETLAIIAYKQPMKQSILIKIRGNKAYDHVAKFVEMGLIIKKKVGHTAEISLSENFYNYFNVADKDFDKSTIEGEKA